MLEAALHYAERGWLILPLHSVINGQCTCGNAECAQSAGKHPLAELVPHGLKEATTDASTVRRWFTQKPSANIGIATGTSSHLMVLDIDPRHGGNESIKQLT